jgi:hypothetical protein
MKERPGLASLLTAYSHEENKNKYKDHSQRPQQELYTRCCLHSKYSPDPKEKTLKSCYFFSIFSLSVCLCVCAFKVDSIQRTSIKTMYGFFFFRRRRTWPRSWGIPIHPWEMNAYTQDKRKRETAGAELFQLWKKVSKTSHISDWHDENPNHPHKKLARMTASWRHFHFLYLIYIFKKKKKKTVPNAHDDLFCFFCCSPIRFKGEVVGII